MGDGIIDGRGGDKMLGQNISWWDLAEQSLKGWPDQYNNWSRDELPDVRQANQRDHRGA
jgi:hypothetical protein